MYAPCHNHDCPSYGKSHPNCRCYDSVSSESLASHGLEAPGVTRGMKRSPEGHYVPAGSFAEGGEVHYCSVTRKHKPGCEYYAEGGEVPAPLPDLAQSEDPQKTLGHAVINRGLLSLMKGTFGNAYLRDEEKHNRLIDDAKAKHRFRQLETPSDGLTEEDPVSTVGSEVGDKLFEGDHEGAAEALHGQPLVGDVNKSDLAPIIQRLAKPMIEKDTNARAFRGAADYLDSAVEGGKTIDREMPELLKEGKPITHLQHSARESSREELKEKLESAEADPSQLIESSGNIGHYLPEHAGPIGATIATAMGYLKMLKPKKVQTGPLDPPSPADPIAEDMYNRQLDIANKPLAIIEHIKDGTLHAQDVTTLKTIYPGLFKTLHDRCAEEIINAKSKDTHIHYNHRVALSLILGQPLDGTMTQASMDAIISSAPGQIQPEQPQKKQGRSVTAQTQKTIAKADRMYETPLEQRQIDKKD